ncbi:hypothetical protein JVU11DRAFT_1644 [Chiua virens]|nr:hypothetical protein JVU11DRAFT_1644 [Chiua virens]
MSCEMDRYLSVRKPTTVHSALAASPYPLRTKLDEDKQRWSKYLLFLVHFSILHAGRLSAPLVAGERKPSSSKITKHLLSTLSDSSNPITHSNIYERSDTIVSATTGHQRGEGRTPHGVSAKVYFGDRSSKLSLQRREKSLQGVLNNVRVYIDGYLSGTTDIEMKRIIAGAGGTTLLAPNGATHIVTSRQLSGSKTNRILTTKSRELAHIVKPEWVTDSIVAGRRLQESHYALIKSCSTRNWWICSNLAGPANCITVHSRHVA